MHKEILISVEPQEKRVAILESGRLEEFYAERPQGPKLVGNIYKGKVVSLLPAIGAAFIDIGLGRNGFLYISDLLGPSIDYEDMAEEGLVGSYQEEGHLEVKPAGVVPEKLVKKGQELLAQVLREPFGNKGPRLTTHISLPGKYLVLLPMDRHIGISKRIKDAHERNRLKNLLAQLSRPKDKGLIVRTAGREKTKKEFARDLRYLLDIWAKIGRSAKGRSAPSLVYEEYDLILRIIRDYFTEEVEELTVDCRNEYRKIRHFLRSFYPNLSSSVKLHLGDRPLFEKRGVEEQIERIFQRKIPLPCGGYLLIEPTEALVAIDVNSGKFAGKKNLEETALFVNRQAAREIARQIRLRDMGGIIVIDFIDMKSKQNRQEVLSVLEEALMCDRAKTEILSISELGLVEMTRQRIRKNPIDLSYQVCSYCQGRGQVKSTTTIAILALRRIKQFLAQTGKREVHLALNPDVASHIFTENKNEIVAIENRFKAKIKLTSQTNLHIEEMKFLQ